MEKEDFFNRWGTYAFILILMTLLAMPQLYGQEFRATVSGEIMDPSNRPIPAATVNAVQLDTQRKYTAKSNRDGIYVLQYLPPGRYQVTVTAPGFKTEVYSDVPLESAQKLNLNMKLSLGAVHQEVTVTASPGLINTATASPGGVVDHAEVQNLPTIFGNPFNEFMFVQGIRDTNFAGNNMLRGTPHNMSAEGAPGGHNAFYIDGAPVSNQGKSRLTPNSDSVQELQVSVSPFNAQYAWNAGGSFNATLKAGSNRFHGDLHEYNEFTKLEANRTGNNVTGAPQPEHIVNRFGGSLGGPIQKGETFFFSSYEGDRSAQPLPNIETVPTAAMRQGDFSGTPYTIYDPTTVACVKMSKSGCNQYGRTEFSYDGQKDIIPPSDINPVGKAIVDLYPAPNLPGVLSNYVANGPRHLGYNQYLGRVDHNFGQNTRIYGLYIQESDFSNASGNGFAGPGSTQTENPGSKNEAMFDLTRTISPNLMADFKVSFNRWINTNIKGVAVPQDFTADKLGGLQMPFVPTTTHQNIAPSVSMNGFANLLANTSNSTIQNNFYFSPSLSEVVSKHTLHYGFQYTALQYGGAGIPGAPNGSFTFNGRWTRENPLKSHKDSGSSVADLLLGDPSAGNLNWNQLNFLSFHFYGLYLQDDWKVRRNFTLNIGLRWDHYRAPTERYNRIHGPFCLTCTNPYSSQIDFATYSYLPNPLTGGWLTAGANGLPRTPYSVAENNWQPRAGFAWAITPKTVFRAGFGLYTDYGVSQNSTGGFDQNTPYIASLDGNINPSGYFATGTPYPNGVLAPPPPGLEMHVGQAITYYPRVWHVAWTQHWRADIQRALPGKIALDIAYAGSHSHGLNVGQQDDIISSDEQQACFANPSVCNQTIPNPFYGVLPAASPVGSSAKLPTWELQMRQWPLFDGIELTDPIGYSNFNALEVNAHRRLHSLDFVFNYEYSNWMQANSYLNNGTFREANMWYGPEGNDWRHTIKGTVVWPLTMGQGTRFFRHAHGIVGGLINHWLVDTMFLWHTGSPLSVPAANLSGAPGCTSYRGRPRPTGTTTTPIATLTSRLTSRRPRRSESATCGIHPPTSWTCRWESGSRSLGRGNPSRRKSRPPTRSIIGTCPRPGLITIRLHRARGFIALALARSIPDRTHPASWSSQ